MLGWPGTSITLHPHGHLGKLWQTRATPQAAGRLENRPFRSLDRGECQSLQCFSRRSIDEPWYFSRRPNSAWRSWVIQHRSKAFLPHCLTVAAPAIAKGAADKRRKGFARRGLSGMQICNRCEWSQKAQLSRSGGAAITAAGRAITACSDTTDFPAGIPLAGRHTTCPLAYRLPAGLPPAGWLTPCPLTYPIPLPCLFPQL